MLADEITTDLRSTRDLAITLAQQMKRPMTLKLLSKGVKYGLITGNPDGSVDMSKVQGVDADLRRHDESTEAPAFARGKDQCTWAGTISCCSIAATATSRPPAIAIGVPSAAWIAKQAAPLTTTGFT